MKEKLNYLSGFNNYFNTEAQAGALPTDQNNPQNCPMDLFAEQLSGTAFTAPRAKNKKSWLYKLKPSVIDKEFKLIESHLFLTPDFSNNTHLPTPMRWDPMEYPSKPTSFIESLTTYVGNGNPKTKSGCAIHLYACNQPMEDTYFYNSDGDFLVVPQEGELLIKSEFGLLSVTPSEVIIIPRGIKFQIDLPEKKSRGYVCENFGSPFELPELGPIGANGLANPRDFLSPVAWHEEKKGTFKLQTKFLGNLFETNLNQSPLNVVAWHGNYYPYKYDLKKFNTINTVSFDHPDPSIFTVLTSPSAISGTANIDFVIFPPRWMVAENTFRPPYYHRNTMSEFMGLIHGIYDAKQTGFTPGGASLHNCMSPHGPDKDTFQKASQEKLKPEHQDNTLAFMLETNLPFQISDYANKTPLRQKDYLTCWKGL